MPFWSIRPWGDCWKSTTTRKAANHLDIGKRIASRTRNLFCKGGLFRCFFQMTSSQRTLRRAQKLLEPQQEAKGWSCQFIGTRWAGGWPLRWCSHTSCNGKWRPDDTCSNPVACNSQFALRKLLPHPSGFGPIPYTWDQTRFPTPTTGWPSVSRVVAQHAPRAFDVRC